MPCHPIVTFLLLLASLSWTASPRLYAQSSDSSGDMNTAEAEAGGAQEPATDEAEAGAAGADDGEEASAAAGRGGPSGSSHATIPTPPGFYRGNISPGGAQAGWYLSLLRLVPVLGVFLLWVWSANWVDEDSSSLKVRNEFWNTIIVACGFVGLLAAICAPSFYFGFTLLSLAYAVPMGFYILERNAVVPASGRVMTPEHISTQLSRLGMGWGSVGSEARVGPNIKFIGKSTGKDGGDEGRARQVENSRGFVAAKELVYDAILRRATDIHLEPKETEFSVRMRIDGVMFPTEPFDRALGDSVINIFKVLGAMDITEKRRALDGSFRALMDGRDIDFRVATQGTRQGEKLSLRILDQSNSVSRLEQMGVRSQLLKDLQSVIHQPHGMLLVCGPTGAGKSTTLYAALNDIDAHQHNIITIEDPIEYKMDNVTQIEINTKAGQTFGGSLRSVLRQDPDVVMIGEIRDPETAAIACQAANTGHMVFSTVHSNDAITALYRLIDLGVEPYMLASSLSAVLAQRLARRLCPQCREAYKPDPDFLKKSGLPPEKVKELYRPPTNPVKNCSTCGGLGYQGRVGVFEFLQLNDRMRDMLRDGASASAITAEARKSGMLYMKEEGLRLVVRGTTSVDELMRVAM